MDTEEFAKQFFDIWQQAAARMMCDPVFSREMLNLMQKYGANWQQWQGNVTNGSDRADNQSNRTKKNSFGDGLGGDGSDNSEAINDKTPFVGSSTDDVACSTSVAELAARITKCERKIEATERLLRQTIADIARISDAITNGESAP